MQRSIRILASRRAGLYASTVLLRSERQKETLQRLEAEQFAQSFEMKPMAEHPRSEFEYKGSSKGAEVGARNEAAFMDYEEFKPKTLTGVLVMPGNINLLTVAPLYCALLCVACAAWGIFYWDLYCRKHYETVLIARPKQLQ